MMATSRLFGRCGMKVLLIAILFFTLAFANNSTDPDLFCLRPVARALTFNTYGINTGKYLFERIGTFAAVFPQFLSQNDIDVACLQELWDPEIRNFALAGVNASHVYHPEPLPQPGCQNACFNTKLDDTHPIVNQWVLSCSLTPIPQLGGKSCSDLEGNLEYQQCILQVCPDLVNYVLNVNPSCVFCLTTPVEGENMKSRVGKCASNFNAQDAANCKWAFGGQADSTIVTRLPILEREYFPYPEQINPLSNRGITYVKLRSRLGLNLKVFCTHMITSPEGLPPDLFVQVNAAQVQASLEYVKSKTKPADIVVYLGDTNNGIGGKTWNAIWPQNFEIFNQVWKDALGPKGACTYGCSNPLDPTPEAPRDIDHIFVPRKSFPPLSFKNTSVVLNQKIVQTVDGYVPLSDHSGVVSTICIGV